MGALSGVIAVNVESHQKRGTTNEGTQTRARWLDGLLLTSFKLYFNLLFS